MKQPDSDTQPLPEAPAVAVSYLGEQFDLMRRFGEHLADTGVSHGLVGPREVPRLWDRHILNCAVVADLLEPGDQVADVGSGAGLPGVVIAIARPDVHVTLVEPLLRRVTWLQNVIGELELPNVTVIRSRAEQCADLDVDVVTSRAVARLDVLSGWSLPLLRPGGRMLALKGSSALEEVDEARSSIEQLGGSDLHVVLCGEGVVDPPTAVVSVRVDRRVPRQKQKKGGSQQGSRRRRERKQRK